MKVSATVSILVAGVAMAPARTFPDLDRKGFDKLQDGLMSVINKLRAIGGKRSQGKGAPSSNIDPQPVTVQVSATDDGSPFVDYALTWHNIGRAEREFLAGLIQGELPRGKR